MARAMPRESDFMSACLCGIAYAHVYIGGCVHADIIYVSNSTNVTQE